MMLSSTLSVPAIVSAAGDRAGVCILEFFASAIRNPHTRRAYVRATGDFLAWCASACNTEGRAGKRIYARQPRLECH